MAKRKAAPPPYHETVQDQSPPETDADSGDADGQAPAALRWLAAASITALGVAALVILGLTLATIARMAA